MGWDRPRAPLWLGLHLTRSAIFVVALRRKPSLWKPSHGAHMALAASPRRRSGTLSGFLKRVESEMAKRSVKTQEPGVLRMPGFNAEASLYTSPATYRAVGGSGVPIGAVQPNVQMSKCYYCDIYGCGYFPCKMSKLV